MCVLIVVRCFVSMCSVVLRDLMICGVVVMLLGYTMLLWCGARYYVVDCCVCGGLCSVWVLLR